MCTKVFEGVKASAARDAAVCTGQQTVPGRELRVRMGVLPAHRGLCCAKFYCCSCVEIAGCSRGAKQSRSAPNLMRANPCRICTRSNSTADTAAHTPGDTSCPWTRRAYVLSAAARPVSRSLALPWGFCTVELPPFLYCCQTKRTLTKREIPYFHSSIICIQTASIIIKHTKQSHAAESPSRVNYYRRRALAKQVSTQSLVAARDGRKRSLGVM